MTERNDRNQKTIDEFRANNGVVGGYFAHMKLLLLHTTGAKTGKERVNPLGYTRDGDRYIVIASKGGAPSNPDWYYNLRENPDVEVEVGTERFEARAHVTEEPERTQLYQKMASVYPQYNGYKEKTDRAIPVITLERLSKDSGSS